MEILAVMALAGIASFAQSLSGFGFALLLVPPLAIIVGPKEAVVIATFLNAVSSALTIGSLRSSVDRRLVVRFLVSALLGMPVGYVVLATVPAAALQVGIAATVLVAVLLLWRGATIPWHGRLADSTAGALAGILMTSTSMAGPPLVIYLQDRGLPPRVFRATVNAFFFCASALAAGIFLFGDRVGSDEMTAVLFAAPAVFATWFVGHRLFHRLNPEQFRGTVLVVLVVSAAIAIVGPLMPS